LVQPETFERALKEYIPTKKMLPSIGKAEARSNQSRRRGIDALHVFINSITTSGDITRKQTPFFVKKRASMEKKAIF